MSAESATTLTPPKPIAYADAVQRLRDLARALPRLRIRIPVAQSLGYILAESLRAPRAVPGFRHSAMDGYALPADRAPFHAGNVFRVGGSALAGQQPPKLSAEAALAVATGSHVPDAFQAVVPKEQVSIADEQLTLLADISSDANIRHADDDFAEGDLIADIGTRIDAALLAALSTIGIADIPVWLPPRVAIVVTGDEVLSAGSAWQAGHRLDSNGPLLASWAYENGLACTRHGPLPDDPDLLRPLIKDLAQKHDLLLVTGGASVGPADHTPAIFHELGQVAFWRVAVRPGMPVLTARIDHCVALGLPGNPVAVFASLFAFIGPLLRTWFGQPEPAPIAARLEQPLQKSHRRLEWRRGRLRFDSQGQAWVQPIAQVSSGAMQSVIRSNVLMALAAEQEHWAAESLVPVYPVRSLI